MYVQADVLQRAVLQPQVHEAVLLLLKQVADDPHSLQIVSDLCTKAVYQVQSS